MNQAFIGIVNQTLAASLLIIAVIAVRFIIKRAPKWDYLRAVGTCCN